MECITKCIESTGLMGQTSEYGPNMSSWSPLTLQQIRARQQSNTDGPKTYKIGHPSKTPITLRYGWVCQQGLYPDDPDKENQDAFSILPTFQGEEKTILMGVYDGHGEYGDDCSAFVRDNIAEYLSAARKEHHKDLEKSFRSCFRKLNSDMHFQQEFNDQLSGTTACVAFFEKSAVWVANAGDSRAIIAKLQHGELKATPLSTDQTPYRKDERERIRAAGGEICSVDMREGHVPFHDNWDIDLGAETDTDGDPPRVWMPGKDKPGCAFTRSIGDSMGEKVGVIADPELTKKELKEHDKFVVICSDGVWEFLTNQAVVDMVKQYDDPLTACRAVVAESYRLWLQFDVRTDDITMILAFIDQEGKKKKAAAVDTKGRGSIRGSISIGGDALKKGGARPVRRGLSKAKKGVIAALAESDGDANVQIDDMPLVSKSAPELERIGAALKENYLFKQLTAEQRQAAFARLKKKEVGAKDLIYSAGDTGDACYVIDSGEYVAASADSTESVTLKGSAKTPYPLFGEVALMQAKPRAQTVTCRAAGTLWVIERKLFLAVLKMGTKDHSRAIETLKSVSVLRSLNSTQLKKVAETLKEDTWNAGDYIVRQGDNTQSLYLIMEGHVQCTAQDPTTGDDKILLELHAGQYVGERSLLMNMPRAANVIATRLTKTLNVSKDAFEAHLGDLNTIIQNDSKKREYVANKRLERQIMANISEASASDFAPTALISEDAIGQFVSVTHTKTGRPFTYKAWGKQQAVAQKGVRIVMQEHRIATALVEENRSVPSMM